MRRKMVSLLLLSIMLLACTCSVPSMVPVLRTPATNTTTIEPTAYLTPTETPTAIPFTPTFEPPTATAIPVPTMVIVRLHPQDGSLMAQISAEVQKAAAWRLKPFVEFDASW